MVVSRLRSRLLLPALLFLAAFALPVEGWLVRNYRMTGVVTISTIQGINLAYYRAAGAIAAQDRISVDEAQQQMLHLVALEGGAGLNPAERARVEGRVGLREIARHPWGYIYIYGCARNGVHARWSSSIPFRREATWHASGISDATSGSCLSWLGNPAIHREHDRHLRLDPGSRMAKASFARPPARLPLAYCGGS
jgi:hypothetical protein